MLSAKRGDRYCPGALEVTQEGSFSAREGPGCHKGGNDPQSGPCTKGWISAGGDNRKKCPRGKGPGGSCAIAGCRQGARAGVTWGNTPLGPGGGMHSPELRCGREK